MPPIIFLFSLCMSAYFLASCSSLSVQQSTITHTDEGFYTYPSTEDNIDVPVTMAGFSGKLFFREGCILLYDGKEVMTPIFPDENTVFDRENKTLIMSGVKFEMGDHIYSGGWIGTSKEYMISNDFNSLQDRNCLQDKVNYFRGVPENLSKKTN